ncbi:MAG: TonB family protein [Chromatiales bacterium]|nr:TonB family protein [Chromatiales bacterium]
MSQEQGQQHRLPQRLLLALLGSGLLHAGLFAAWQPQPEAPIHLAANQPRAINLTLVTKQPEQRPVTEQVQPPAKPPSENEKEEAKPAEPTTEQTVEIAEESNPTATAKKFVDPQPSKPQVVQVKEPSKKSKTKPKVANQKPLPPKRAEPQKNNKKAERVAKKTPSSKPSAEAKTKTSQVEKQVAETTPKNRPEPIATSLPSTKPATKTATTAPLPEKRAIEPQTDKLITLWLEQQLRHHFRYPRLAQRRGLQGTVTLQFTVQRDGLIDEIVVLTSSGHGILDRNARKTLEQIGRVTVQQAQAIDRALELKLPITYRLEKS